MPLTLLALLPSLAFASTTVSYVHDSGVIAGGLSIPGYSYANPFIITDAGEQTLTKILVKQPEAPDPAGTCDVYLWAADGAQGTPGTVLASATDVAVPQGTDWTAVDFSAQHVALSPGTKVYAGIYVEGMYVYFDDTGGVHSFRKSSTGSWAEYGSGYLMVRMETYVDPTPTIPGKLIVTPTSAALGDTLKATASGSTSADTGQTLTYQYQWSQSVQGAAFGGWALSGRFVTPDKLKVGDRWKARARARIPGFQSAWVVSKPVTIRRLIATSNPVAGQKAVQRRAPIDLTFSWPILAASVPTAFTLTPNGGTAVPGTFKWLTPKLTVRFTPDKPLAASKVYGLKLAKTITRVGAGPLKADTIFYFTTGNMPVPLTWSPISQSALPTNKIIVNFDRPMTLASFTKTTFKTTPVTTGTFATLNRQVTYTPSKALTPLTTYTVWVSADVTSSTGVKMGRPLTWTFKTGAAVPSSAPIAVTASAATAGNGATAITVNLASAASVGVEITNLAGRHIATLTPRDLPEGISTLLWSGRSDSGTRVPAGRYFARVEASSDGGTQAHCQAAIQR